MGSWGSR